VSWLEAARQRLQAGIASGTIPPRPASWACRFDRRRPRPTGDYIDWGPFFQTWDLAGRYPRHPRRRSGGRDRAQAVCRRKAMLERIVAEEWLQAKAVFGLFPANAVGDDIEIYTDEDAQARRHGVARPAPAARAPGGQAATSAWPTSSRPRTAACRLGRRLRGHRRPRHRGQAGRVRAAHDDYHAIMLKALADRLAEACAEWLHERVRRECWGYAADETLTTTR
jgi:5-methyltetrahydrofolate--homocysteine methyltransferase